MPKRKVRKKTPAEKRARPTRRRGAPRPRDGRDDKVELAVVGIGASAGGWDAIELFFRAVPADPGVAFVVVQHLDPTHKSALVELLGRRTSMPVSEVEDGVHMRPNRIYVIPPNSEIVLAHGMLRVSDFAAERGTRTPIDTFLRSLAREKGPRAVAVILSGSGSDGTAGVRAIKAAGGMTLAQTEDTAKFDDMPHSAIATGAVDRVLAPEDMPAAVLSYVKHPYAARPRRDDVEIAEPNHLERIFRALQAHTGHDFTHYKRNTILRRTERRLALHQINSIGDYARYLQQNKAELDALFKELLIGVTSFFRDPDAFEALRQKVIAGIFKDKSQKRPVRVWVPGCATGEEAYSVAMLLVEEAERRAQEAAFQIFATDIDNDALDYARAGTYPASIAADVGPERLRRFFVHEGAHYRIRKNLRDTVVLAKQDLTKDPPFSRLDLIVCRNLLIYLGPALQKKILPLFHYTLNYGGHMMLGPSETIGGFADLFALLDKKWKIFRSKPATRHSLDFPTGVHVQRLPVPTANTPHPNVAGFAERVLLASYTPACVVVNDNYDVVYFHGRTGQYLEPPVGNATLNILKMAHDVLRIELRSALHKAAKTRKEVRSPAIQVVSNGRSLPINLIVRPFADKEAHNTLMLVVFEEAAPPAASEKRRRPGKTNVDRRILDLEQELNTTKETLQATIEELEASNEELKSTNEELQSTNEELQSTNEELETSKEELQSVNEELVTVNTELQIKLDELAQINNDMTNLLSSTDIATLFLDRQLRIKGFTPAIARIIKVIAGDVGRPLGDIVSNLVHEDLPRAVEDVLQTLAIQEREAQAVDGKIYLMKILPYRAGDSMIDGAVVTFVDITDIKNAQRLTREADAYAEQILATMHEPIVVLNAKRRVVTANEAFYRNFGLRKEDTEDQPIFNVGGGRWNLPALRTLLDETLPTRLVVEDFTLEYPAESGFRRLKASARLTPDASGQNKELIVLALRSMSES